jgi:hypothetical protein
MPFEARYGGWCANCPDRIKPGDQVRYTEGELAHVMCLEKAPEESGEPCKKCFLFHAGECM